MIIEIPLITKNEKNKSKSKLYISIYNKQIKYQQKDLIQIKQLIHLVEKQIKRIKIKKIDQNICKDIFKW